MKKLTSLVSLLLLVFVANAQTKNFIDQPYIEVSGSADTLVTPNEIFIRIILSEKDTRDRVSIEEQEQKLITALKALGLDTEKDLTTSDITSNFKSYLLKSKDVIKTKIYTLKVTDAVTASKVFMKLEEVDISNTSIERVDHSDVDNLKNRMRTKAIVDAQERAMALTKPLNQTIGTAIHIADADNFSQQLQGRVPGLQIRGITSIQSNNGYTDLPKIEFEKIKVTASINAKFILK
ncbi:SIMPL domain-containing protein [Microcoleus sp. F10-A1]|uniref:SIMPL domain-containing protein n=1 Tax=Microcoleus sp. F10-A1 TaxID=2818750 RepID=UPI002FCE9F49